MRKVFADAYFWIGLFNTKDQHHDKCEKMNKAVSPALIFTSELVLTEFLNSYADKGQYLRKTGVVFCKTIEEHNNIKLIKCTQEMFKEALNRYENRPDKTCSLTDCSSFNIMEKIGITEVLSGDKDFERENFLLVSPS